MITGTFNADFSAFHANVVLAETKLNQFEGSSKKVEAALQQMVTGFDGTKIIGQASMVAEAVERIGGASKLTESEQKQVNATVTEAINKYEALGRVAPASLEALQKETAQTVSVTEQLQKQWVALTAATGAAWVGIEKTAAVMGEWSAAASDQENALKKLETALKAQGTYTPELMSQYEEMANQFQRTTVNADELTNEMQALLVQVGDIAPEQMDAALRASMDLAAGLGKSLPEATMLVAKAIASDGESLGRLKQLLGDTVEEGTGAAGVLEAINSKFGGQAAAQAETYAGKMAILKNTYGETEEAGGRLVQNALSPLADLFLSMPSGMQGTLAAFGAIGQLAVPLGTAVTGVYSAFALLAPMMGTTVTAALASVGGGLAALVPFLLPAGAIIAGITGIYLAFKNWDAITEFVQGVYEATKTWLVDRFGEVSTSVGERTSQIAGFFGSMRETIVDSAQSTWSGVSSWFVEKFGQIRDGFRQHVDLIVAVWRNLPETVIGLARAMYEGIKTYLVDQLGSIVEWVTGYTEKITGAFGAMYDAVVGHSYVPDMVAGIEAEINRLQDVMVSPAVAATEATTNAFASMSDQASTYMAGMLDGVQQFSSQASAVLAGGGFAPSSTLTDTRTPMGFSGEMQWANYANYPTELLRSMGERLGAQPWTGAGGDLASRQWTQIQDELRRRGTSMNGGVSVTVNAQGSFYDTPESVQKLADKVGNSILNRIGR